MSFPGGYPWPVTGGFPQGAAFPPAPAAQWPGMQPVPYNMYGNPPFVPPGVPPVEPMHEKACARCKKLKIKCEMRSVDDVVYEPCRRCVNGGHSCRVPEKTERKIPVKRGELLQKIQEQAARIQELEAAVARCTCGQSHVAGSSGAHNYSGTAYDPWARQGSSAGSPSSSSAAGSSISDPASPYITASSHTTSDARGGGLVVPGLSHRGHGDAAHHTSTGLVLPTGGLMQPGMTYPVQDSGRTRRSQEYSSSLVGWDGPSAYRATSSEKRK